MFTFVGSRFSAILFSCTGSSCNFFLLQEDGREVLFHTNYSRGTAAIRGTEPFREGHHFWEVKMTTPVYGTDMMIGVATEEMELDKYRNSFCSLLGNLLSNSVEWGSHGVALILLGNFLGIFLPSAKVFCGVSKVDLLKIKVLSELYIIVVLNVKCTGNIMSYKYNINASVIVVMKS